MFNPFYLHLSLQEINQYSYERISGTFFLNGEVRCVMWPREESETVFIYVCHRQRN